MNRAESSWPMVERADAEHAPSRGATLKGETLQNSTTSICRTCRQVVDLTHLRQPSRGTTSSPARRAPQSGPLPHHPEAAAERMAVRAGAELAVVAQVERCPPGATAVLAARPMAAASRSGCAPNTVKAAPGAPAKEAVTGRATSAYSCAQPSRNCSASFSRQPVSMAPASSAPSTKVKPPRMTCQHDGFRSPAEVSQALKTVCIGHKGLAETMLRGGRPFQNAWQVCKEKVAGSAGDKLSFCQADA